MHVPLPFKLSNITLFLLIFFFFYRGKTKSKYLRTNQTLLNYLWFAIAALKGGSACHAIGKIHNHLDRFDKNYKLNLFTFQVIEIQPTITTSSTTHSNEPGRQHFLHRMGLELLL